MSDSLANRPWVVLVGGFLGAGKTTLILAAARELERRGKKCAVILNDQGEDLVDTGFASMQGFAVGEVTGGCFCCRLSDLVEAIDGMRRHEPEVIFAEPVGSCTDLSATVFHPLSEYRSRYRLAPLSVLVDPARAQQIASGTADANIEFLFRNQLDEADLVCLTKSDLHTASPLPAFPGKQVRRLSAVSGEGVAAWLDEILSGELAGGARILDIDYARYAEAEAALAWLNLRVLIKPAVATSPAVVLGPLLDGIAQSLDEADIAIVHMKALIESPEGNIQAAITEAGEPFLVEGDLTASPASEHELRLNIRALGAPDELQSIVEEHVRRLGAGTRGEPGGELVGLRVQCFRPSPPVPERRIPQAL